MNALAALLQGAEQVVEQAPWWQEALAAGVTPVLVVALLLSRKLWTDGAYQAMVDRAQAAETRAETERLRADRNEAKVDELVGLFRTDYVPALTMATSTIREAQRINDRLTGPQ